MTPIVKPGETPENALRRLERLPGPQCTAALESEAGQALLERLRKNTCPVCHGLKVLGSQMCRKCHDDLFRKARERFDPTAPADVCWPWMAHISSSTGYGVLGRGLLAHRFVWEMLRGPIPKGLTLDHLCHNAAVARGDCFGGDACPHRRCVNPSHLEPVSSGVNTLRGHSPTSINARKTECLRGHPFTPENTRPRRGGRGCRTCDRARDRVLRERARASRRLTRREAMA